MSSSALVKRPSPSSFALMPPPPPPKRIKRPPKVLDEDDYTEALSKIIARDYFPGLLESQTQQEYLTALESNNPAWIAEAGAKLREVMTPGPQTRSRHARAARNSRFITPIPTGATSKIGTTPGATPRGFRGDVTPASSVAETEAHTSTTKNPEIDTTTLSLSAFQSKYTSEDNESFNSLLDKQNTKRRQKHAYLWSSDQRLPSARQIAHRNREAKLLAQKAEDEATGKALIPITIGGDAATRPAKPDDWKINRPDNTFMFPATSVDEEGLETVAEARERISRAGPKAVVYANTRFPPPPPLPQISLKPDHEIAPTHPPPPSSPSLSAIRAAISGHPRLSASEILPPHGTETPRVNGFAFVDDDEPANIIPPPDETGGSEPTYRDLLAGQVGGDGTPNPFRLGEVRRREGLHLRMVERVARAKRAKQQLDAAVVKMDVPRFGSSPVVVRRRGKVVKKGMVDGGLMPAAQRLLDRVGRTPISGPNDGGGGGGGEGEERGGGRNMWTPTPTPRRKTGL